MTLVSTESEEVPVGQSQGREKNSNANTQGLIGSDEKVLGLDGAKDAS